MRTEVKNYDLADVATLRRQLDLCEAILPSLLDRER